MGKKTTLFYLKLILVLLSTIILSYLLIIERGINPKINHLLQTNIYFWGFIILIALIITFLTILIGMYIFEPCVINPIFEYINSL